MNCTILESAHVLQSVVVFVPRFVTFGARATLGSPSGNPLYPGVSNWYPRPNNVIEILGQRTMLGTDPASSADRPLRVSVDEPRVQPRKVRRQEATPSARRGLALSYPISHLFADKNMGI